VQKKTQAPRGGRVSVKSAFAIWYLPLLPQTPGRVPPTPLSPPPLRLFEASDSSSKLNDDDFCLPTTLAGDNHHAGLLSTIHALPLSMQCG
jgi:hypothetical protein